MLICISGCGEWSGVLELGRKHQLSPIKPLTGSSSACSSTSRSSVRGRRTINWTTPLSFGASRRCSSAASSCCIVRCFTLMSGKRNICLKRVSMRWSFAQWMLHGKRAASYRSEKCTNNEQQEPDRGSSSTSHRYTHSINDQDSGGQDDDSSDHQSCCGTHQQVAEIDQTSCPGETLSNRLDRLKLRKQFRLGSFCRFNCTATRCAVR